MRNQKDGIRMKPEAFETMNTLQPDVISVNGVEVPSYQKVWKENMALHKRIGRILWIMLLEGAALFLIGLEQLLK